MTVVTIRRARPEDAAEVAATMAAPAAVAGTLQLPFPSVEVWRERLAKPEPGHVILVAEADGAVVAHAGIHPHPQARRKHAAHLGISVRDDWHGKGVGTQLMAALVDLADNWMGLLRIELTVFADNAPALALYRRFGFEIEGTHRAYALRNGALVDTLSMARLNPNPPRLPA